MINVVLSFWKPEVRKYILLVPTLAVTVFIFFCYYLYVFKFLLNGRLHLNLQDYFNLKECRRKPGLIF
jgi:hypothetical protein